MHVREHVWIAHGSPVGDDEGEIDGEIDGDSDGDSVGSDVVGEIDGEIDGESDGEIDGDVVGVDVVGDSVGDAVIQMQVCWNGKQARLLHLCVFTQLQRCPAPPICSQMPNSVASHLRRSEGDRREARASEPTGVPGRTGCAVAGHD